MERALDANELNDPLAHHLVKVHQNNAKTVEQFLEIIGANHFNFMTSSRFMADVIDAHQTLTHSNITDTLRDFLTGNTSQFKELDHA